MRRLFGYSTAAVLAVALGFSSALAWPVAPVTLDKPIPVSARTAADKPLIGRVTNYDADGFSLVVGQKAPARIAWGDLDAHNVFLVRSQLIKTGDGNGWIELGTDLLGLKDGSEWADRAFTRALRIDPTLKTKIEQAKTAAASPTATGTNGQAAGSLTPSGLGGGPQVVGTTQDRFWGPQSDDDQAAAVKELEAFADETRQTLNLPLTLYETRYFLFYSNLSGSESANWAGLLDRMYARLAELFAVPTGQNIWRGKGLIFVFSSEKDYARFEDQMHHTDAKGTAGLAHCFGDGMVHIAFYRQSDQLQFAHVLVHESVHGFVHRYRSPIFITSWINEGLAETIASELVPDKRMETFIPGLARVGLRDHDGHLGDFFTAEHIAAWQYPVAQTLTTFMIRQSKQNYVDFINGIKDGLTWQESMETKYKVPLDRLVWAYGKSMGEKVENP